MENYRIVTAPSEIARTSRIEARMRIVPLELSIDLYKEGFEATDILVSIPEPASKGVPALRENRDNSDRNCFCNRIDPVMSVVPDR